MDHRFPFAGSARPLPGKMSAFQIDMLTNHRIIDNDAIPLVSGSRCRFLCPVMRRVFLAAALSFAFLEAFQLPIAGVFRVIPFGGGVAQSP
jgi:hypothetical protein